MRGNTLIPSHPTVLQAVCGDNKHWVQADPITGNHSKVHTQHQPQNVATKILLNPRADSGCAFYRKTVAYMLKWKDV